MRAVLDTNVFVSGIHWKGIPSKILKAMLMNKFVSITSNDILVEFVDVMKNFKIPMKNEDVIWWENFIVSKSEVVLPKQKFNAVKNDPDDNKFVDAAVEGNCSYIVSRDKKHLLRLKEFRGIKIITPEEFIKLLE